MPTAQQRNAYRVLGRCLHCGGRVLDQRQWCARCRDGAHRLYWTRRQAGLCVQCGKQVRGKKARCLACTQYQRERQWRFMARRRAARRDRPADSA
jgi:predicted amidophosphoribosyltransferase